MNVFEIIMRSILVLLCLIQLVVCILWNSQFAKYRYYKSVMVMSTCIILIAMCFLVNIFMLIESCDVNIFYKNKNIKG